MPIDFDALTAPIAGEQPAGAKLPPDVRKKMEDARREFEAHPDDPSLPPIAKKPDWSGIIKWASDSLSKSSKDLLAAVRLVEALAKRDGFEGLRDGLKLLRMLVTDCWDRVHPLIEEPDDLEFRAGPIQWLADPESGAWFPSSIRKLPLVRVLGHLASLQDCQDGKVADQTLTTDALRAAEPATKTTVAAVAECLQELERLDQALGRFWAKVQLNVTDVRELEKLDQEVVREKANQAPVLAPLRDVLGECQTLLGHLGVSQSEAAPGQESPGQQRDSSGNAQAARPGSQASRAETYRQLSRLADELALLEPHSPIPDLLRWAVKLGSMPFRQLIQELIREPNVLADIRRQFGIKETEGDSTQVA